MFCLKEWTWIYTCWYCQVKYNFLGQWKKGLKMTQWVHTKVVTKYEGASSKKNTENGVAVTSLRSFLFRDDFSIHIYFNFFLSWQVAIVCTYLLWVNEMQESFIKKSLAQIFTQNYIPRYLNTYLLNMNILNIPSANKHSWILSGVWCPLRLYTKTYIVYKYLSKKIKIFKVGMTL